MEPFLQFRESELHSPKADNTLFNVVAQYDPNYKERLSITEKEDGTVEFTSGICLDILLSLQISMNFSYVPLKGNGWVGRFPNGSWTGMTAQVVNREADISISQSGMIIMINDLEGISFLHPTATGQFIAVFHQPKASSYRNLITSVFSNNAMVANVATWIIVTLSVHLLFCIQNRMKLLKGVDLEFVRESSFWVTATACLAGWYKHPTLPHFKVVCLTAASLGYIGYVAFSAGITVNLVTELVPIQNLDQLALSNLDIFRDQWLPVPKSLFKKLYDRRTSSPTGKEALLTIHDALAKLLTGSNQQGMAFITFTDALTTVFYQMNFAENIFCDDLSTVILEASKTPAAMFVKRGSQLKNTFNYHILMMGESGILQRLNKHYDINTQIRCIAKPHNYRGGLGLDDIWTAFAVLAGGIVMSLLGLNCEKFMSNVIK